MRGRRALGRSSRWLVPQERWVDFDDGQQYLVVDEPVLQPLLDVARAFGVIALLLPVAVLLAGGCGWIFWVLHDEVLYRLAGGH